MLKNTAGQAIGAQMLNVLDGLEFTGAVTVYVTGDRGTQAVGSVGSGACTHEGKGFHSYAPAQAETNYDHVAWTFEGVGAITVTVQVFTTTTIATLTDVDLANIIAGVQSVSSGIVAAQDASSLYITEGDTWIQDVEGLGDLTDKTVVFSIKSKLRDADSASIIKIVESTGLTVLNGAVAATPAWGSITILDTLLGDIRLRLESNATVLLKSGTYIDAIKALEATDDRTLRQRGTTVISAGVIDGIS